MTDQLSEKEIELERELNERKQVLSEARAEFEAAETAYEQLRKKHDTAQRLDQLAKQLAELAQLNPLNEESPFTGESLEGADQVNQHYAELVERINAQVGAFRKRYNEAESRVKAAEKELTVARQASNKVAGELEQARPLVRTSTIMRTGSDGVERAYVVIYRRDTVMPWSEATKDKRRFRKAVVRITLLMLILAIILPFIPLPEPKEIEVIEIPERVAQLIQERKPPPPPPPPPPKKADKQPKDAKKKQLKPRKQAPKAKTEVAKAAREKAQRSGLLAFRESFADLMDNSAEAKLGKQARVTSGGQTARKTERSLITTAAGKGSQGINVASLSRDVAGTGLKGRGTSRVTGVIGDEFGDADRPLAESIRGSRTDEEIQLVFDRNKSALYSIYQRELRKNPTLKGKIVLKITIAPSGKVLASAVVSSDLNSPELERKIAARVKLFNFGGKDVDTITINYPIDFLPA